MISRWVGLFLTLFVSSGGWATELMPWFGNDKEFELRTSYLFQHYGKQHGSGGVTREDSCDHFVYLSLAMSPTPKVAAEIELSTGCTSDRDYFEFDAVTLTARYNICNDVVGDPWALTTGLTVAVPTSAALRDRGSLYHDEMDIVWHLSLGQEVPCGSSWSKRAWAVLGVGIGLEGSPWAKLQVSHESNYCDCHLLRLFARGQLGFGHDELDVTGEFPGYAHLGYSVMELGVRYTYVFLLKGALSMELLQRIMSRQAPRDNTALLISYLYTFGI